MAKIEPNFNPGNVIIITEDTSITKIAPISAQRRPGKKDTNYDPYTTWIVGEFEEIWIFYPISKNKCHWIGFDKRKEDD